LSDGKSVKNPHYLRQSEELLKETQSNYSKIKHLPKDNKKKQKTKKKLVKLHYKVKNQRKDFLHKLSRKLVRKYSHICVEKLNVKGMLNKDENWKSLNKSISDSGWTTFRNQLNYKAEEAGSLVIEVNPKGTSKTCSKCGSKKDMPLENRMYECPVCKLKIGRDLNSSYNILRIGLDSLGRRKITLEAVML
jgi:putative transposase